MTGFTLNTFSGIAPKVYARLLPNDMAQVAQNTKLDSGRLEPMKGNASATVTPVASYSSSAATKTLFRYSSSIWIGSNDDLNIVRSPIAEDPHERLYVTGIGGSAGYPRVTSAQVVGNDTYYRLGLPTPASITSVALTPSTSTKVDEEVPVTMSYLYTYGLLACK